MSAGISQIDEHIERVRAGGSLSENEVKELCDKVSLSGCDTPIIIFIHSSKPSI